MPSGGRDAYKTIEPKRGAKEEKLIDAVDIIKYRQEEIHELKNHDTISKTGAQFFREEFENKYQNRAAKTKTIWGNNKVLFIDDEGERSAWYNPLRDFFKLKGIQMEVKEDYYDDMEMSNYSIILLDLLFNGNDRVGIDLLKRIREKDLGIPIIMLTADNTAYNARRCLLNGANDYFVKDAENWENTLIILKN